MVDVVPFLCGHVIYLMRKKHPDREFGRSHRMAQGKEGSGSPLSSKVCASLSRSRFSTGHWRRGDDGENLESRNIT
jgi:hypothetical protein